MKDIQLLTSIVQCSIDDAAVMPLWPDWSRYISNPESVHYLQYLADQMGDAEVHATRVQSKSNLSCAANIYLPSSQDPLLDHAEGSDSESEDSDDGQDVDVEETLCSTSSMTVVDVAGPVRLIIVNNFLASPIFNLQIHTNSLASIQSSFTLTKDFEREEVDETPKRSQASLSPYGKFELAQSPQLYSSASKKVSMARVSVLLGSDIQPSLFKAMESKTIPVLAVSKTEVQGSLYVSFMVLDVQLQTWVPVVEKFSVSGRFISHSSIHDEIGQSDTAGEKTASAGFEEITITRFAKATVSPINTNCSPGLIRALSDFTSFLPYDIPSVPTQAITYSILNQTGLNTTVHIYSSAIQETVLPGEQPIDMLRLDLLNSQGSYLGNAQRLHFRQERVNEKYAHKLVIAFFNPLSRHESSVMGGVHSSPGNLFCFRVDTLGAFCQRKVIGREMDGNLLTVDIVCQITSTATNEVCITLRSPVAFNNPTSCNLELLLTLSDLTFDSSRKYRQIHGDHSGKSPKRGLFERKKQKEEEEVFNSRLQAVHVLAPNTSILIPVKE